MFRLLKPTQLRLLLNSLNNANGDSLVNNYGNINKRASSVLSSYKPIDVPNVPLDEAIFEHSGHHHQKIALECGITGRRYTYGDLRSKAVNFSGALKSAVKLRSRDVVAVILPNIPEFAIVSLGIIRGGLICTPLNPIYTPEEIARQLKDSDAKVVVTIPELWKNTTEALIILKKKLPIICIKTQEGESLPDGSVNFAELIDRKFDVADSYSFNAEDLAFLPYSSGTTGLPKGVRLSTRNFVASAHQITSDEIKLLEKCTANFQEVLPAVLPFFHIYGFTGMLTAFKVGGKLVTLPRFSPDTYIDTLRNHKPTLLTVVPPIILYLTNNPNVKPEYMSNVRAVLSGAAPLGKEDEERFLKKMSLSIKVLQGYGLTEASVLSLSNPMSKHAAAGSVGNILPNCSAKIVALDDDRAQNLGPNKTGELLIKGPQVMSGYHNRPEETAASFADGWFRTGDLGYYDEHANFFITDRIKELIKVKGFQVAPAELEEIIRGYANVVDCAVIGVPHKFHGEVPRAHVVPKKGAKIDVDGLQRYVADKVAEYKRLEGGVAVVDAIPKNVSGKILRREIRLAYLEANK